MATLDSVTDQDFDRQVLWSEIPVLVDFWATWCGTCRSLMPTLEDISAEYAGKVRIVKINADENPQAVENYGIFSLPTMILFRNGRVVTQLGGTIGKTHILDCIKNYA
ncbi:thioredoxin [Streptomyces sp. NBC_01643]|uniref:thioredoxin n=1 Tax=Streptomyces sp. NBC_01643 TaxID=2975906 RepID=UPI00386935DC|nr:thioredoxin [Streptomyces sp. NBC_01643]